MQRVISVERIFPLKQYANIKWREEVTLNDDDMSDAEVDALRHSLVLNCFLGYALHNKVSAELNDIFEDRAMDPEELLKIVLTERELLMSDGSYAHLTEVLEDEDERPVEED